MTQPKTQKDYALWFAERGMRVIPLIPFRKRPRIDAWQKQATTDKEKIEEFFSDPTTNLGVVADSLVVLDVDKGETHGGKDGPGSLRKLMQEHGKLPPTLIVRTPSGGTHFYFKRPELQEGERLSKSSDKVGEGLDIQTGNAYLVGPGTVLDEGDASNKQVAGTYEILLDSEIAELPQWLFNLIVKKVQKFDPTEWDGTYVPQGDVLRTEEYYLNRLRSLQTDGWRGDPWDQTTFWVACCLIEISNHPANNYPLERAQAKFFENAPEDSGFGYEQHLEKWESALNRTNGQAREVVSRRVKSVSISLDSTYDAWDNLISSKDNAPVATSALEKAAEMYYASKVKNREAFEEHPAFVQTWPKILRTLEHVKTEQESNSWLTKAKLVVDKLVKIIEPI